MALKLPGGMAVAKGIVYGGAGGGLLFYLGASIWSLHTGHTFSPADYGAGFVQVLGGSTAAVIGHSRYMGGGNGMDNQSNSGN